MKNNTITKSQYNYALSGGSVGGMRAWLVMLQRGFKGCESVDLVQDISTGIKYKALIQADVVRLYRLQGKAKKDTGNKDLFKKELNSEQVKLF